jgi:hypothetical protein
VTGPTHLLDNTLVAFIATIVGMTATFVYSSSLWSDLFAVTVSWVLTDIIFSFLIAGGGGIFMLRPFSTETLFKGKAYLVFLGMIIFSTYASSYCIDIYLKSILTSQDTVSIVGFSIPRAIIATNFAVGLLAFLDFNARFYQRQRQRQ